MKSKILFLYKIESKGFLDCLEWNNFITRFPSFFLGKSYVGLNNDLFNKEKKFFVKPWHYLWAMLCTKTYNKVYDTIFKLKQIFREA